MSTPKGARLDLDGIRGRVWSIKADVQEHLKASMVAVGSLSGTEAFLADSAKDLCTLLLSTVAAVEREYRAEDARSQASAAPVQELPRLHWVRHTDRLWDCTVGVGLWVLEKPADTWYLVRPSGNACALRCASETDARQQAHCMIHAHYEARTGEGDGQ